MCTGAQVREARRLLGWSTDRMAGMCNMNPSVIRTYEATGWVIGLLRGPHRVDRVAIIRGVLEGAGVVFADGEEPGVKLGRAEG